MKIETHKSFGRVKAFELGWSPVGRPMMTVHLFIVGRVMIDTGLAHMRKAACRLAEEHGIASVLLTHYHEDHAGNAAAIARRTGAPLYAHALTCEKMRRPAPIFPYQHLIWGTAEPAEVNPLPEEFQHDGLRLLPVHTPGHSRDHTVFLEPERGWLFSGDLYLGDRIKYFRADENIADQIRSLRTILAHDFDALFCAHRPVSEGGKDRLAAKLDFLEDFYGRVVALADEGMDVRSIMKQLKLSETRFIKYLCFGNVSMANMVRSVITTRGPIVV
jgi:glyoxylase-like metal-dependent hydrolase (beta-lactamase superfamily II)